MERILTLDPAWDKRDTDPKKNYGIHGVELRMVLKGPKGATQFVMSTGWFLPETIGANTTDAISPLYDYSEKLSLRGSANCYPSLTDLGYHSYEPMYEGQYSRSDCHILDGGTCYYDGSSLNAARPFEALLREGDAGVWRVLEEYYNEVFHDTS